MRPLAALLLCVLLGTSAGAAAISGRGTWSAHFASGAPAAAALAHELKLAPAAGPQLQAFDRLMSAAALTPSALSALATPTAQAEAVRAALRPVAAQVLASPELSASVADLGVVLGALPEDQRAPVAEAYTKLRTAQAAKTVDDTAATWQQRREEATSAGSSRASSSGLSPYQARAQPADSPAVPLPTAAAAQPSAWSRLTAWLGLGKPEGPHPLDVAQVGQAASFLYKGRRVEGLIAGLGLKELKLAVQEKGRWKLREYAVKHVSDLKTSPAAALDAAAREAGFDPAAASRRAEDLRAYRSFLARDVWRQVGPAVAAEIQTLRALRSKDAVQAVVRQVGEEIVGRIQRERGTANIGFHYNLHGGQAEGYVEGGGIRATMGDIALNYTMHGDRSYKVYFFQSKEFALYDVLDERNPNLFSGRMGSVLNVFRLDSPFMEAGLKNGAITNFGKISADFDTARLWGIPYETYLAPPLDVFYNVSAKMGFAGRLSRDEETLAVMRYLEAAVLAPALAPAPPTGPG